MGGTLSVCPCPRQGKYDLAASSDSPVVGNGHDTSEKQDVIANNHSNEGGDIDEAQTGAQLEDRFYNNKAFEKPDIDSSNPEQQDAALKIQTKYRQHHAKQVVGEKRQEQAVVKIQAGYRGWHDRKRVEGIRNEVDAKSQREAEEAQEDDARDDVIDYDNPEVANAATTIQAGFKGYKARKEVQDLKTGDDEQKDDGINYEDPDVQNAATKIQAGFKGMHARKQVKEMKDAKEQSSDVPAEDEANQSAEPEPQQPDEEQAGQSAEPEPQQQAEEPADPNSEKQEEKADDKPDEIDIDLNDPDVNSAATKIQAGFKGYKTRKELGAKKDGSQDEATPGEEVEQDAPPQEDPVESQQEEGTAEQKQDGEEQQ